MTITPLTDEDGREYYVAIVHPSWAKMLELSPREKWKMRYREERMRRKGYPENEIKPFS